MLKKFRSWKGKDIFTEWVAALIITSALLLSVILSYISFWQNRQSLQPTEQAAAQVEKPPEKEKGSEKKTNTVVDDPFLNYQQLSDPFLVLVNARVPLPENWQVTPRMVDDEQVDLRMYEDLSAMYQAAAEEEVWFWTASGYRSREDQQIILDRAVEENVQNGMTEEEALETALHTIAMPGHSEHHTGLAVDLNDVSDNFEETEAYRWLKKHGADFGFVQRYRADKSELTGIDNESWHYRYVGKKHAKEMERLDMCLEEYVLYLKDKGLT